MELIKFNAAKHALMEAVSVDEVRDIRDKAEAIRAYAKQSGESLEMVNRCAEIKVRAERRAGELLAEMPKRVNRHSSAPTMGDLEINANQSHRWQRLAAIPEQEFVAHIEAKRGTEEITTAGLLRLYSAITAKERRPRRITRETIMDWIRSAVEKAAEHCQPSDVPSLQAFIRSLADELPDFMEPLNDH